MDIYNLVSFGGMVFLLFFAWCISKDRKNMNWSLIGWGIAIQLAMALFIFIVPAGSKFFLFLNDVVIKILDSSTAGAHFLFGRLAVGPGQVNASGETSLGFILAFQAFPTIIFFSSLISILYFCNIMPLVIRGFAFVFTKLMKISGAESLSAASNIFVGIESALTVKPHLKEMTPSELCTVLTVGMATVASNVLVLYVLFLQSTFPSIAAHLISASLLSAPAALVMSKILLPESGQPKTLGEHIEPHYGRDNSLFEAIINGANAGVKMIVGVSALLIAVLGLVSLFDLALGFLSGKFGMLIGFELDVSLKRIMGYIFYPFTVAIGVPFEDARIISSIIGERVVVTEVVAYQDLAKIIGQNVLSHPRSFVLASYALCGFAHLPSMAIFVGGVSALAPSKTSEIASVAIRALIAATLGCLMTAAVAGIFFTQGSLLI